MANHNWHNISGDITREARYIRRKPDITKKKV
jgi:hypothetical protein